MQMGFGFEPKVGQRVIVALWAGEGEIEDRAGTVQSAKEAGRCVVQFDDGERWNVPLDQITPIKVTKRSYIEEQIAKTVTRTTSYTPAPKPTITYRPIAPRRPAKRDNEYGHYWWKLGLDDARHLLPCDWRGCPDGFQDQFRRGWVDGWRPFIDRELVGAVALAGGEIEDQREVQGMRDRMKRLAASRAQRGAFR